MNHSFNTSLAGEYGIEGAILIECLYWWIKKNECEGDMINDERVWCRSSAKGFNKYIPYMSAGKIRRELVQLEEQGVIIVGNFNQSPINQTLWYSFTDDFFIKLDKYGYDVSHFAKMKNGFSKNEKTIDNNILDNNIYKEKNKNKFLSKKEEELAVPLETDYDQREHNFEEYMRQEYPLVQKMREPLTYAQFRQLRENYERDTIFAVLSDMNNWAELRKKRVSAYKTALKWLSNDKGNAA